MLVVIVFAVHSKTSPISTTLAYSATTTAVAHKSLDSITPRRKTKKNPLPWNGYHPARKFIFDETAAGRVTSEMGSRSVHNKYKNTARSFKLAGMEYSSTFAVRLAGLQKIVARDRSQDRDDMQSL